MIVNNYLNAIKNLPEFHSRLIGVQVENNDWRKILDTYDTENTFFYLDPPYVMSTRSNKIYNHEMTDADHEELIDRVLTLKSKVLISGYDNNIYSKLTQKNNWKKVSIDTVCHSAPKTKQSGLKGEGKVLENQKRVECLWFNYVDKVVVDKSSTGINNYF